MRKLQQKLRTHEQRQQEEPKVLERGDEAVGGAELPAADDNAHLPNMGRMVEEMENRMRDSLQDVYFGKTKSTVNRLYKAQGAAIDQQKDAMAAALRQEMARRGGAQ